MTHGSLFSGIGGFDLASEWMGWENKFHCEWNEFGQKVLKYYWPNAESFGDITKTDFKKYNGTIDIISGGFPCQPYSTAGKRKGKADERHLWPEMLRAIREIQPSWVVGENVLGLVNWRGGLVFDEVQSDLEIAGYEVFPYVLPACAKNAPHRRDRVWFVAHATGYGHKLRGFRDGRSAKIKSESIEEKREWVRNDNWGNGKEGITSYTNSRRQSREEHRETEPRQFTEKSIPIDWQNFPTQSPLCSGDDGISTQLDFEAVFNYKEPKKHRPKSAFPRWRNESIKALGNAIVPQVAFEIFKAIEQYEAS